MGLLIVSIILNCVLVVGIYFAEKYTPIKKWTYLQKQIVIGVLFGGASAFASSFGVEWLGAVVNVRDAAPLSAGLIFGAPAGIIAGAIGGLYRWFSVYWGGGMYTRVACSIATVLAGLMAAAVRMLMCRVIASAVRQVPLRRFPKYSKQVRRDFISHHFAVLLP